jgi:hypothetical protein
MKQLIINDEQSGGKSLHIFVMLRGHPDQARELQNVDRDKEGDENFLDGEEWTISFGGAISFSIWHL